MYQYNLYNTKQVVQRERERERERERAILRIQLLSFLGNWSSNMLIKVKATEHTTNASKYRYQIQELLSIQEVVKHTLNVVNVPFPLFIEVVFTILLYIYTTIYMYSWQLQCIA